MCCGGCREKYGTVFGLKKITDLWEDRAVNRLKYSRTSAAIMGTQRKTFQSGFKKMNGTCLAKEAG